MTYLLIFLLGLGITFLVLAGVGILRLPDLFCRASATTKAATLGAGLVLLATTFFFQDAQVTLRVVATMAFLLLTAPVGAHVIARAAYRQKTELWSGTIRDELADWQASRDDSQAAK